MPQKMTPAQYNALVRREVDRVNRANKAAADKFNRQRKAEIDAVNRHNRKVVDDYNREVRRHNENAKAAVRKYNSAVAAHNNQVRQNRQALSRQIAALKSQVSTVRYYEVRSSSFDVYDRFESIEREAQRSPIAFDLLALSEREASNSANVAAALLSDAPTPPQELEDSGVLEYLAGFSQDLCDRWKGAIFALNPANTDAARHFCTSVREIFSEILEKWAHDEDVLAADPQCERTPHGTPSRRAKIKYLLKKKGADTPEMLGFVESDIDDIIQLFRVFNEATHGAAGKHGFVKLLSIRQRVEGGIMFLAAVAL